MQGTNGYFCLVKKENDIFVRLYTPLDGGEKVRIDELEQYLQRKRILTFDVLALKKAIDLDKETDIYLMTGDLLAIDEEMRVEISEDKMKTIVRFYPPYAGGSLLGVNEIVSQLAGKGVVFGLQKETIQEYVKNRLYCTDIIFAKGLDYTLGKDAEIVYHFEVKHGTKPSVQEDGSVDFFNLDNISHINKGDVLATLVKEVEGKPGKSVTGTIIPCSSVKKKKLRFGRHITLSEDKMTITSDVDGHVELVDGKVFVSDTFKVSADVDLSTGNIEYDGNIDVIGNVRSGFTLKAKGDITIGGIIEGATIIAGRDIVIRRGVQGMGKAYLEAKNNIFSKFIENARVKCEGSVSTESILHSHIAAKNEVIVAGKRGFVTGGSITATKLVEAKIIGSVMGTDTRITVGATPENRDLYKTIQEGISRTKKNMERIKPIAMKAAQILSDPRLTQEMRRNFQEAMRAYQKNIDELREMNKQLEDLEEYMDKDNEGRIKIRDKVYPGVRIYIFDSMYIVKDTMHHCQFLRKEGDIYSTGL